MIHYNPHDWTGHLCDIRGSMVRVIALRVLLLTAWAAAVVVFDHQVHTLRVSAMVHTLVGVALGLLLVVRTNASYDRYWEARRQWGALINAGRNLGRVAAVWLAGEPDLVRKIAAGTGALCRETAGLLRRRGPSDAGSAETEHAALARAKELTEDLAGAAARGRIGPEQLRTAERYLAELVDCVGACERIHSTPLPFAYVVHLRRSIIVYLATLPFAILNEFDWITIPAVLMLGFIFLGVEEIGVEIEDPFGDDDNDLPLEDYCKTLERNLTELTARPVTAAAPSA
jgi:putative membrane protein